MFQDPMVVWILSVEVLMLMDLFMDIMVTTDFVFLSLLPLFMVLLLGPNPNYHCTLMFSSFLLLSLLLYLPCMNVCLDLEPHV